MTDKEKLEKVVKLADGMYYAAQYLTTDASRLHRAMDEYHQFIITEYNKQEPISEDFESEWERYCDSKGGGAVTMNVKDVAKHFAQWQKESDAKSAENFTRLNSLMDMERTLNAHYKMGIRVGKRLQKERMMKDVVEFTVCGVGSKEKDCMIGGEFYSSASMPPFNMGDKVKVIIIKE